MGIINAIFLVYLANAAGKGCPPPKGRKATVQEPKMPATTTDAYRTTPHDLKNVMVAGQRMDVQAVEYGPLTKEAKGTVVYLCGGPDACIAKRPKNVPDDYRVVTFDYVGLGKNRVRQPSSEMRSLETQGSVAAQLVQQLGLKDYVMYGHSFGTAVATVAASYLSQGKERGEPPRAVILEGTSGPRREALRNFGRVAERVWADLSPDDQASYRKMIDRFRRENPRLKDQLVEATIQGLWNGSDRTARSIKRGAALPLTDRVANLKDFVENYHDFYDTSAEGTRFYRAAGCQVIRHVEAPTKDDRWFYAPGLFKTDPKFATEREFCGCRTIARDYDPKNFPISVPIVYINGDADPGSPYEGAREHYNREPGPKAFLKVAGGGHYNSWADLKPCVGDIYASANKVSEFGRLEELAQTCGRAPAATADATTAH